MTDTQFWSSINDGTNRSISYSKVKSYTQDVEVLVRALHDALPSINQELEDLKAKLAARDNKCKPFEEKIEGLEMLVKVANTTYFKDLYYWYIDSINRKVS